MRIDALSCEKRAMANGGSRTKMRVFEVVLEATQQTLH